VGAGSRKGVGCVGEWPRNARRGHVHGGERRREVSEGEVADRWGPRASEGERTVNADRTGPSDRERERARARKDWRRQAGPTGQREGER
jgi:hypothetical protein